MRWNDGHQRRPGNRHLGRQFLFGRRRLRVLEGEFGLLDEPLAPLGLLAPHLVLQLGDDELLVGDQSLVFGGHGPGDGEVGNQPVALGDKSRNLLLRKPNLLRHEGIESCSQALVASQNATGHKLFYPAACGRQVSCGFLQSIPSSM